MPAMIVQYDGHPQNGHLEVVRYLTENVLIFIPDDWQ